MIHADKVLQYRNRGYLDKISKHKTPYNSLIYRWVNILRKEGTLRHLNSKAPDRRSYSGRKGIRDEAFGNRIRKSVQDSPNRSTRRKSQELGISLAT